MRLLLIALSFAVCPIAFAQSKHDYSGVWKKNCQDEMGLVIKPLHGQYAVLFCKNDQCSEPGAYRPNSRIDNDPMYEVQSEKRIKVRDREGSYSIYVKCGGLSGTP
jgi:hypothetical protein